VLASPVVAASVAAAPAASSTTTDKVKKSSPVPVFSPKKIAKTAPPAKGRR
jgi:hypothetical protein